MSEPLVDTTTTTVTTPEPVTTTVTSPATDTIGTSDAFAEKLKSLLIALGHDVEAEFDTVFKLAKLSVSK